MNFPFTSHFRRRLKVGGWSLCLMAGPAFACGPDFPNRYLDLPAETLLAAPEGFFAVEIGRLVPTVSTRASPAGEAESGGDVADFESALKARGEREERIRALLENYRSYRKQQRRGDGANAVQAPAMANDWPEEFSLYVAGADAWYAGEVERARAKWQALLELPEARRRYRSTWAAYMLGRSSEEEFPPAEAVRWFALTRTLAAEGSVDSCNLAGASWGREAHRALEVRDYACALELYLNQHASGDETAYASLRLAAKAAANGSREELRAVARSVPARQILTAWFLARFSDGDPIERDLGRVQAWCGALAAENIREVDHAVSLAWLAYEAGEFCLAEDWSRLASEQSPETRWIRGKLALRAGRVEEAARELRAAGASGSLAPIYRSAALGELGRLELACDHREAALAAWLDGQHWQDAAYVAERLLTIDELAMFLRTARSLDLPVFEPYAGEVVTAATLQAPTDLRAAWWGDVGDWRAALRDLLARRLVRAGRTTEARAYFCPKKQNLLQRYVEEVATGFNPVLRAERRAQAFWRAAQLVRAEGMELMGTELEPDFSIWGGSYAGWETADCRLKLPQGFLAVTAEERSRLEAMVPPAKRFSYRYRAADLAWWAASLLPNDRDETAVILHTAGGWLKGRDPAEANRFYQALVIRCGRTELGRAAAQRHWFPDMEPSRAR